MSSWGAYEIDRRAARWREVRGGATTPPSDERPGSRYGGRTYIQADDAIRSLVGERIERSPLRLAANHLAEALGTLEDRLCDPSDDGTWECASKPGAAYLTIPAVTSADLRAFATDLDQMADPNTLRALSTDVMTAAAAIGTVLQPLPLGLTESLYEAESPTRVGDDEAVLRLESSVAPRVASIEALQAALATQLDKAARAIGAAARRSAKGGAAKTKTPELKSTGLSRGEEIDAAAASPQLLAPVLRAGLPWADYETLPFNISNGQAVPTVGSDLGMLNALYLGIKNRSSPSRATLLSPENMAIAARETSGRKYAWIVFDSAEGCFAVRAAPQQGRIAVLDSDAVVAWLRPRLVGSPPHKIATADYLGHLRSRGLMIEEGPRREAETRFDLSGMTTEAERAQTLAALRALTAADFTAFDWSAYDQVVGRAPCEQLVEVSGDAIIDLAARTVVAPKVRQGSMWSTYPHKRSYVTYHSHPSTRFRGSAPEEPSNADLLNTLDSCAANQLAWAFVTAPEGTYIIRPSQLLIEAYRKDWQQTQAMVNAIYPRPCEDTPAVCVQSALSTMAEAGFVALFHDAPCLSLATTPDLANQMNRMRRGAFDAEFAALAAMPAVALLTADWAPAASVADFDAQPALSRNVMTWLSARLQNGVAMPTGEGHVLHSLEELPARVLGPLLVIFVPNDEQFPSAVPSAVVEAARQNAELWAWVVLLSPRRVTVLRVGAAGVEIHGPAVRRAEKL